MHQHQSPDTRLLCHVGSVQGTAHGLSEVGLVHTLLKVPAHTQHHVGTPRQLGHAIAGPGVASEDYTSIKGIYPISQGVQPGLNMLGHSGGYLPVLSLVNLTRADVLGFHRRWSSGQGTASVEVYLLAEGVVYASDPVMGKVALFFI